MVLLAFDYMYLVEIRLARSLKGFQGRGIPALPSTSRHHDFDHFKSIISQGCCRSIGSLDMVLLAFDHMYSRRNQAGKILKEFQGLGIAAHPSTSRYDDIKNDIVSRVSAISISASHIQNLGRAFVVIATGICCFCSSR